MEQLLGKTAEIRLPDHGLCSGIVASYDSTSDRYLISCDNGASENLTSAELSALLNGKSSGSCDDGKLIDTKRPRRGRGRKRKQQQSGGVEFGNVDGEGSERRADEDCGSAAAVRASDGVGDWKETDDSVCEVAVDYGSLEQRQLEFDLNLAAKEAVDDHLTGSRARFDLNLGCDQVIDVAVNIAENHNLISDGTSDGAGQEAKLKKPRIGSSNGALDVINSGEKNGFLGEISTKSSVTVSHVSDVSSPGDQVKEVPTHDVTLTKSQHSDDSGGYQSGTRARQERRTASKTVKETTEPVPRRSARRSGATFSSSRVPFVNIFDLTDPDSDPDSGRRKLTSFIDAVDMLSSNVVVNLTKQRFPEEIEDIDPPPTKLQLPESSQDLKIDGVSMLNLISIYSFIRSFSTILFLSPFELEDFCAALKCKSPTLLFDQTHLALLQILRKHLQYLSAEGSQSASVCLRSLNWDFLDPVSWPLFVIDYILIMKPDFDIKRLNFVDGDYYKQPESLKVDILSILCDDLVDAECIRAEINTRSLIDDLEADPRLTNIKDSKRKKANMNFLSGSSSTGETMDEINDWNNDECCLCKVDGNLICCDGCPAAYHSRCVGVASELLPEGDWYCPECNIDRDKARKNHRMSVRGADSLGVDPDGRIYFGSGSRLLVFDSHENDSAIRYYCKNDLHAVIKVLRSSDIRYGAVLNAISQYWDISVHQTEIKTEPTSQKPLSREMYSSQPLGSSETCSDKIGIVNGHSEEDFLSAISVCDHVKRVCQITSSEGSAEVSPLQNSENIGEDLTNVPAKISNLKPESPEDLASVTVSIMNDSLLTNVEQTLDYTAYAHPSGMLTIQARSSLEDQKVRYSNFYRLAHVASSVAEDLFGKCSDKTNKMDLKSNEASLSSQLKAILKKSSNFCWSSSRELKFDAQKENCGWCYCCKTPDVGIDCLFKLNYSWPAWEDMESLEIDHPSKCCGKGHLIDVVSYVLFIENRLHGLLFGPWLNPQHSMNWSKSILESFDLASVKHALLTLESNLNHLALSAEWSNYLESAHTLGSACYAVTSSSCLGLKHGVSRKRGRSQHADSEVLPTPNAATDLDFFWWRGGRTSRHVFNWKVLPRSSALKAARQAGGCKIPGVHYPDASEFAKRRRNIIWRAAVENSSSVEQLAFLVRELDSNIKWYDIENTNPFTKIDKKLTKASRLFKKVIIRRKRLEGTIVKYLLDFGKRKTIPDIVVTHGSVFEESESERKKYWLEESMVPVHMVKSFEENRIGRKNYKMKSGKLFDVMLQKGRSRPRDFSYLFSRAEKLETCECGHCGKLVPVRESVQCQFCEGSFHRQHVRRSKGIVVAGDKYSCLKCHQDKLTKAEIENNKVRTLRIKKVTVTPKPVPQGKVRVCSRVGVAAKARSNKVVMQIPLRRSSRKIKFKYVPIKKKKRSPRKSKFVPVPVSVNNQKTAGRKRGRPAKMKKSAPKKVQEVAPMQKKRTQVQHSYWLNGLKLAKNPDDERAAKFRKEKLLIPSEDLNIILNQPICTLCSQFTSHLTYICCEVCEDWFHGRAFGVDADIANNIIGFRCHSCCKKEPPVCPVLLNVKSDGT